MYTIGQMHCGNLPPTTAICLATAILIGCTGDSRRPLHGTVALDGQPLKEGYISFRPMSDTSSPTAGAAITIGKFSIDRQGGPMAGRFRVEITASRPSGRRSFDQEAGKYLDDLEQYLPARYNTQSELAVDVQASGPSDFHFDLKSTPAK